MYIQLKNITKATITRWNWKTFPALKIWLCGLYKDDNKNVKFLEMTDTIINKLKETKIDITIPELEWLLKDHEIEKLLPPPSPNLFNTIPTKLWN